MGVQARAQLRCPECNFLHDVMIDLGTTPDVVVVPCKSSECGKFFAAQPIFPTELKMRTWRMIPPNTLDGEADGHEQPVDDSTGAYAHDPEAQKRAEADALRGRFS